jgi:hypothetical protein
MSETERYLKEWPCGCREWTVATVDGDTIEDESTERFEPCAEYRNLQAEFERLEAARAGALAALVSPGASSLSELESVAGEIECHHYPMYKVRTPDA